MAGVTQPAVRVPGAATQMRLIAGVRWRMLRHSLGAWQAKLDVLARALVLTAAGVIVLLIGLGLGALAFFSLSLGRAVWLAGLLWGVFAAWQLLPVMAATFGQTFPFRDLLRFPLRFPSFFLLSLGYGLFDPASLAALVWLGCIAVGVLLAGSEHWPAVLLALPAFALLNLTLGRVVSTWLERLLARRHSREMLLAVFLIGVFTLQFGIALAPDLEEEAGLVWRWVQPVLAFSPPHLLAAALIHPGIAGVLLSSTALLAAYALLFGALLAVRLRKQYLGEDLGESPAATASARDRVHVQAWHLPQLAPPVAATFEKEIRYFQRSTMQVLNALLPVVMVLFFMLFTGRHPRNPQDTEFLRGLPDLMFPGAVLYALTVLFPLVYNSFAFERRGIQFLFSAPVRFRDVLLGKNLAHAAVVLADVVLIGLMLVLMGRPPDVWIALATLASLGVLLPAHYALGNVLSLHFPRALDYEKTKQQMRGTSILLFLAWHVVLVLFCALIFAIGLAFARPWISVVIFALLAVTASRAYLHFLDKCTHTARAKRDILCEEIGKG